VQAGLPQYHAALRQATGYTGQFAADPTQKFQQYISGATPEQQAASNALSNIYGSGSFAPGTTTVVQSNQAQQPPDLSPIQTGITGLGTGQQGLMTGQQKSSDWYHRSRDRSARSTDRYYWSRETRSKTGKV
jgi:hypothetical protein